MKKLIILICFIIANILFAQANSDDFFVEVDKNILSNKQLELLKVISARPTTEIVKTVRLNEQFKNLKNNALSLNLSSEIRYIAIKEYSKVESDTSFVWVSTLGSNYERTILVKTKEGITGTITLMNEIYKIEPLGQGFHALIFIDESKFPNEGEIDYGTDDETDVTINESRLGKMLQKVVSQKAPNDPTIDVLVAYTTAAKNAVGSINGLIQTAVTETNLSYSNSDIDAYINLIKKMEVNYSESSSLQTDCIRLRNTSDNYMDNVHTERNKYSADVCVLIVDHTATSYVGYAYMIKANAAGAFAVVDHEAATGYYSFGHEIGHLYGAGHNREIYSNPYYTYGHGYINDQYSWRTIMSYSDCNQGGPCTRLQYWSNPNIYYGGITMGTALYEDNARVLDLRVSTLEGFRERFNVNITGPSELAFKQWGTFTANTSGGSGSINYSWYKKYDGSSTWNYRGNNVSRSERMSMTGFTMKVVCTRGPQNDQDTKYCAYNAGDSKNGGANGNIVKNGTEMFNYPNPFNPSTTINYSVSELSDVNITVYDIAGKEIITWNFNNVNTGNRQVQWSGLDRNNLQVPAGTYFYSISITSNETNKTVTNTKKMLFLK